MQHITSLEHAKLGAESVVTIGVFDGVHRGHQLLISKLIDYAQYTNKIPVVLTFDPHPQMVLRGFKSGYSLTLPARKAQLLGDLGVELIVTHPFNDEIRQIRASDFVSRLIEHLRMSSLWVGANFAMGYQREGNVEFLKKEANRRGFELRVVDLMDAGGENVSSTRIRSLLANGEVKEASRLLGRPHSIVGRVVKGAERGRTIGIPTANLMMPLEQALPTQGVYAGQVVVEGQSYQSVINIGTRPTFEGRGEVTVETHLLDFSGDLYDKEIAQSFMIRLRGEKKFDGVDALVGQIHADIEQARDALPEIND